MGIVNKEGALYFATGIDNTGLYSGKREAVGILRAMAGEITSFDVFGGLGISAGIAFAQATKESYNFEKRFRQSMYEVATLSSGIKGSLTDYMNSIIDMTRDVPVLADESAKALYQIVSAGHDGADGMRILEVAAKAAVGGVTETATAADAITTILNGYKMSASEAERVSDSLFTTAKLGKTTMGELGKSIAQAAPIAASYGISIDQVLAAVVSITKQGVPTAEAMTKIRAAIMGASNVLGDAAFQGRTFQDALQLVYDQADGSTSKLKDLLGTDEALQAALILTGKNAKSAAADLAEMGNSAGASEKAFQQMRGSAENQTKLLVNNIYAYLRPLGQGMLAEIAKAAESINEAFSDGTAQESLKDIGALITTVTVALVGYKGSIIAASTAKQIYATVTSVIAKQRTIEAANLVLNKGLYAAEATTIATNTSARTLLTKAIWAQTAAQLKNAASMLTNPYVLAAAAFATLGYVIYRVATQTTEAEKGMKKLNDAAKEAEKNSLSEQRELAKLKGELSALTKGSDEYNAVKDKIVKGYGKYYDGLDAEIDKVGLTEKAYKKLTDAIVKSFGVRQYDKFRSEQMSELDNVMSDNLEKIQTRLIDKLGDEAGTKYYTKIRNAILQGNLSRGSGLDIKGLDTTTIAALDKVAGKDGGAFDITNRSVEGYIGKIIDANKLTDELDRKAKIRFGITDGTDSKVASKETNERIHKTKTTYKQEYDKARKEWENAKKALTSIEKDKTKFTSKQYQDAKAREESAEKSYKDLGGDTGGAKQGNEIQNSREQTEQYKILLSKQQLEKIRAEEDLQIQVDEARIKAMEDGSDKTIAQMELNFEKEMQAIDRQKEDMIRKRIDDAREIFNSNPGNTKGTFDASGITLSGDEVSKFGELYKSTISNFEKQQSDYNKKSKDAWNEYLREFGSYQEKRQAIIDSYKDKIEKVDTKGEKASLNARMQNELDALDDSVQNSATLMGQLFADASQKSVNEIQSVIDKAELLMRYLESVKDEKGNADIGGRSISKGDILGLGISENTLKNLETSADEVESLRNAISKLKGDLGGKSPFKLFETQIKGAIDKINQGGKKNAAQGISEIGGAVSQFAPQVGQFGKDLGNIFGNDDLGSKIEGITGAVGGLGQTAVGVGQIMSGDIVGGAMAAVSGISQVVDSLDGLFGADYSQYNKMKEEYDALSDVWDMLIDKKQKYIDISYGDEARKAAAETEELLNKKMQSNYTLGVERLNAGASAGSHSIGVRQRKGMSRNEWYELQRAARSIGFDYNSVAGGRMTGLFDLSAEQLSKLQEEAPTFWAKLDGDVKEYLQNIIDCSDEIELMKGRLQETMTGVSFDSFYDNFVSTLSDMDKSSKDMADDFGKYLQNAILSNLIANKYRGKIQALYDDWAGKSDSNGDGIFDLTAEESQQLKDAQKALADEMIAERDAMASTFEWSDSSSQSATSGGFQTMSQDVGSELNGRFAALQVAGENIRTQNEQQTAAQLAIIDKLDFISKFSYEHQTEMCDIMLDVLDVLGRIKKDTGNLYFIKESVEAIKDKINNL